MSVASGPAADEGSRARGVAVRHVVPPLLAALALLAGCLPETAPRRDTCRAVVPALVAAPPRIVVLSVEDGRLGRSTVDVVYRTADGHTATITCAFADPDAAGLKSGLVGVRTAEGTLSPARLYVLDRFWLADPAARAEGLARLVDADAKR